MVAALAIVDIAVVQCVVILRHMIMIMNTMQPDLIAFHYVSSLANSVILQNNSQILIDLIRIRNDYMITNTNDYPRAYADELDSMTFKMRYSGDHLDIKTFRNVMSVVAEASTTSAPNAFNASNDFVLKFLNNYLLRVNEGTLFPEPIRQKPESIAGLTGLSGSDKPVLTNGA